MPPKRKVPARRASIGKRISPDSPLTPSGRPPRRGTTDIDYKDALRAPSNMGNQANKADAPAAEFPKKRGRPAKAASTAKDATTATPVKGIPAKKQSTPKKTATPIKAARGRPKAAAAAPEPPKTTPGKRKRTTEDAAPEPSAKRRRRPPKSESAAAVSTPAAAKPGRKLAVKADTKAATAAAAAAAAKAKTTTKSSVPVKKIGRPAGSKNKAASAKTTKTTKGKAVKSSTETEVEEFSEGLTQPNEADSGDEQYWLMKAEPDTRLENGIDVSFPIDKLAAATEPEPWDGVRNAVARNNMRAMRKGDLAFFYHSNCDIPGIVGVMRVVVEHEVDKSAFDPNHPYFDPKSDPSKPKWDCVKVEFVKKFDNIISLKTVKETPELSGMQLASKSYGRLSVQEVSSSSWKHILKMAGVPEDLGVAAAKSGYEADTNGETDKEAAEDSVGLGDEDEDVDAQKLALYDDTEDDDLIEDPDHLDQDERQVVESTQLDEPITNGVAVQSEVLAA